jgi:hypothetical protein
MNKIKGVSGNQQLFDEYGKAYLKKVDTIVDNVAAKTGQSKEVIQKQILRHLEYEDLDYKTTLWDMVTDEDAMGTIAKTKDEAELIRKFLSRVTDKRGNKIYSPEALKKIFNTVTKNGVEFNYFNKKSIAYIKKSVEDYFRMVKNLKVKIKGDRLAFYRTLKSQLTKSINTGKFYDDAFIKQYNKFKNIPEFQNAVQEIRNTVKDMYKTIDDLSSSGYTEKIVRGRRGKVKTVESAVLKGNEFVTDPKTGKLVLRDRVIVPRETLPDAKQLLKATENETFKLQRLKGNVKVSSERVYRMSAYEANQMIKATSENLLKNEKISEKTRLFLMIRKNQDLFSEYINTSLADFVINKSSTAFQASVIDNIIVTGVFSNPDLNMKKNLFLKQLRVTSQNVL